jgi:DNA polymerase theta
MGNGPRLAPSVIVPLNEDHLQGACEYSQRKAISATPSSSVDPRLSLSHPLYGLAPDLIANLSGLGIKNIYPWQKNCLLGPDLLTGEKNLVYSAPTGGGKSLVADGMGRCSSSF